MLALWLADVLHAAGLDVYETPGWTLRGKPMDAIEGVVAHHTASPVNSTLSTNLAVVTDGTALSPGPIAQLLIWRDGSCHVIAAGKANHAGAGGPIPGWMPLSPPGQLSYANAHTIGIEAANDGVGETWPDDQLDAFEIATAAILAHIGEDETHTLTHAEWAPTRKIDPAGPTNGRIATLPGRLTWAPDAWRARIAMRLRPMPAPIPVPPEEDDMNLILYRDRRFNNVFRVGDSAVTVGGAIVAHDKANKVDEVDDIHDESLISYMRASGLRKPQMVPNGEQGMPEAAAAFLAGLPSDLV